MDDLDIAEELQIDDDELELVVKHLGAMFDDPVVSIGEKTAYFNSRTDSFVPERIKWFTTNDYVIGLKAADDDKNGYRVRKEQGTTIAHVPAKLLKEKKIKMGYYKLYKYKTGFAFKRYEQYEPEPPKDGET